MVMSNFLEVKNNRLLSDLVTLVIEKYMSLYSLNDK